MSKSMMGIHCWLCEDICPIKITRKQKPYYICNHCGIQMFIRYSEGIVLLMEKAFPITQDEDGNIRRSHVLPPEILSDYPCGTACIRYRDKRGVMKDWFIGADWKKDNETTLRDHLKRHLSDAEFIGWAIKKGEGNG